MTARRHVAAPASPAGYWTARLRAPEVRRRVRRLVAAALRDLGGRRIADVVDTEAVRRTLRHFSLDAADRDALADVLIATNRRAADALTRERRSLRALLGPELAAEADALLAAEAQLPPFADDLVARLLEQEFVRRLLTDLIFSAIAAFNRRVNPIFGAVATHVLEDQIKGFIRLFMPTLERQAVRFATSRANQRLVLEFGRAAVRQLLEESVGRLAVPLSDAQRRQLDRLIRAAVRRKAADAALRRVAIDLWDAVSERLGSRPLGEVVDLRALADPCTDAVLALAEHLAARADVADFLDDEAARRMRETGSAGAGRRPRRPRTADPSTDHPPLD